MKKDIEKAILKAPLNYSTRSLDYEVGDIVQITSESKVYPGRIGKLIGVIYKPSSERFIYTVQFNDTESASLPSKCLRYLSKVERRSDSAGNDVKKA